MGFQWNGKTFKILTTLVQIEQWIINNDSLLFFAFVLFQKLLQAGGRKVRGLSNFWRTSETGKND